MSKPRSPENHIEKYKPSRWRLGLALCLLSLGNIISCQTAATPSTEIPTHNLTATADFASTTIPTVTPTFAPTSSPTVLPTEIPPTPTATATAKPEKNIYTEIRERFRVISRDLRQMRKLKDPAKWARQISPNLENMPPSFLVLGCGNDVTAKDPKVRTCPNKMAILADQIVFFSFTHDMGFQKPGSPGVLIRSDLLWRGPDGGFEMVRDGFQEATGAPIDFIIVGENSIIGDVVNDGFGGKLRINNPIAFTAGGAWVNDKELVSEKFFPEGEADYTGNEVIQYVTSTPLSAGPYAPELENHSRLDILFQSFLDDTNQGRVSYLGIATSLTKNLVFKKVVYDFDGPKLIIESLHSLANSRTKPRSSLLGESAYLLDLSISPNKLRGLKWATKASDPYYAMYYGDDFFFEIPDFSEICAARTPSPEPCGANFFTNSPTTQYYPPTRTAFEEFSIRNSLLK